LLILQFPIDLDGSPQSMIQQLDYAPRSGYAVFRLFLKSVQDIHGMFQANGINRSEGIASVVGDNLQYSTTDILERLCVDVLFTHLRLVESESHVPLHGLRELSQILMRISNKDQLLHMLCALIMPYLAYMVESQTTGIMRADKLPAIPPAPAGVPQHLQV
jgi:hypothetical protein